MSLKNPCKVQAGAVARLVLTLLHNFKLAEAS